MTPREVREIIRQEMRELRRVLWEIQPNNHDAQTAIDKVREAIDRRFPQSPAEYARTITDYTIDRAVGSDYDLERIGGWLGGKRLLGESSGSYALRLKTLRKSLADDQ